MHPDQIPTHPDQTIATVNGVGLDYQITHSSQGFEVICGGRIVFATSSFRAAMDFIVTDIEADAGLAD